MSIGAILGFLALAAAFAAAAVRRRDPFWGAAAVAMLFVPVLLTVRSGVAPIVVRSADELVVIVGASLMAGTVLLGLGLPRSLEQRLYLGDKQQEWAFDQALIRARQPFVEAAHTDDEAVEDRARWRALVAVPPPNLAWASIADRLARGDIDWADRRRSGADQYWLPWIAETDQVAAEWAALRGPVVERQRARTAVVAHIFRIGTVAAAACLAVGVLNIATGVSGGAPQGRAPVVPEAPPGRHVYLAPIGTFPTAELQELAAFYAVRYDLQVGVLPPVAQVIAPDPARNQINADGVVAFLLLRYDESDDPNNVVIGVLSEDIYVPARPDWGWAFGAFGDRFGVISTARMRAAGFGLLTGGMEQARLRKFVTRYIGYLYYRLPSSPDPRSVLYDSVLSLRDLDSMGEDY